MFTNFIFNSNTLSEPFNWFFVINLASFGYLSVCFDNFSSEVFNIDFYFIKSFLLGNTKSSKNE